MEVSQHARGTYPRRGLHGRVVHELGLRILQGEFPPGTALPVEEQLCAELAVSRSVLREAVKVLAAKGLIEVRPRIGTHVRARSEWNLLDPDVISWQYDASPTGEELRSLAEIRVIVEPAAARLAAERAQPDALERLHAAFAQMEAALDDPDTFLTADLDFHGEILTACGNELLERMVRVIGVPLRAGRGLVVRHPHVYVPTMPQHRDVLDAIAAGEPDEAEAAMRALVLGAQADLEDELSHPRPAASS